MPISARRRSRTLLKVSGLSAGYDGLVVVHGVDLVVEAGSLTVLVGANGAGKTTLLKAIAGVIPNDGAVEFGGEDITRAPVSDRVANGLALVPEGRHLFPDMTVEENLELGGYRVARSDRQRGIERAMQLFPRLAERRR